MPSESSFLLAIGTNLMHFSLDFMLSTCHEHVCVGQLLSQCWIEIPCMAILAVYIIQMISWTFIC